MLKVRHYTCGSRRGQVGLKLLLCKSAAREAKHRNG